jgi:tetratricopeptide (TPR) repeat protein
VFQVLATFEIGAATLPITSFTLMAFQSLLALSLIRIVPKTNFLPHIARSRALSASLPRLASTEPPTAIPIKLASARPAEGDIQTLYNNGLNSFNRGDFEDAQRWFRKAIKVEPGSSDSHYNLGNALLSLGRIDEALQSYQTSLKLKVGLVLKDLSSFITGTDSELS